MAKFSVILPAAGQGTRFSGKKLSANFSEKKPFVSLAGKAVWLYSAERFAHYACVSQIILVVAPEDREEVLCAFADEIEHLHIDVVSGGAERFLSVENGLAAVHPDVDYVAVHDAARPCITDDVISAVFRAAEESGAAIPAIPIVGTIKRCAVSLKDVPVILRTEPRENLWEAQTPQVFRADLYRKAVQKRHSSTPTDDAGLLEQMGEEVRIVPGKRTNIKITSPFDLTLAELYLQLGERKV